MGESLAYPLLGLGNGAVFAALALALVIAYRSSGVVNFATGAIALYIAYTYSFLRNGELLLPFPGLPTTVDLGAPFTVPSAMMLALVIAALFGGVLYLVVFRPLREAPPIAKAVASIGVMIVVQGVLAQRVGTRPVSTSAIFPADVIQVAGISVRTEFLWFAATIVMLAAVLWVVFRFTRFGLATRAVAESEKGGIVSGLSPQRIALVNSVISTVVAGIAGILIAPISPVIPVSYTLFIVPALAAAVVASFSSIPIAVAAGLAIGAGQAELDFLATKWTWLPETGRAEIVPLVLILLFLLVKGYGLPQRGAIIRQSLGRAPRPNRIVLPAVVGGAVGLVALIATTGGARGAVVTSLIYSVIALSLVVVAGYAGQISLAQMTLAGTSAYVLSRLTTDWDVPFPAAPLVAALVATGIGVVVGLPALRVRALSVGVVTLSLAVTLEAAWFRDSNLSGGFGGAQVKGPTFFGVDVGPGTGQEFPRIEFGVLCLVVLLGVAIGVAVLRRSRLGAAMLAVRANERSAAAAGIDVVRVKLLAFALGAFIAGLGGALLAYRQTVVAADVFSALTGLGVFAIVYLAGITSVAGGIVAGLLVSGGILFYVLDQASGLGGWYVTVAGIGLIVTVIFNPEGIVKPFHRRAARVRAGRSGGPETAPGSAAVSGPEPVAPGPPVAVKARDTGAHVPLLALSGITVRYGGVSALHEVSLRVEPGAIVGLIGPNGAGKTTLIDAVSGFTRAIGRTEFHGRSLDGASPHYRARAGLARTFQGVDLYHDLTVEENVVVGAEAARHRHKDEGNAPGTYHDLDDLFDLLQLQPLRHCPAGELSQGQRQIVSIARALAGRPSLVLLDEPAGGLGSGESTWLAARLRDVRDSGVTVLLVDHDMDLVLTVCDRIVVLDLGQVIADGPPDEIRADPAVRAAYLGTDDLSVVSG